MFPDDTPPSSETLDSAGISPEVGKPNRSLFHALTGFEPRTTEQFIDQATGIAMGLARVAYEAGRSEVLQMQRDGATKNAMRRLSNGWRIDWYDQSGHEGNEVDDLKGLDYIAKTLETPHDSVPTVRLLGIESEPVVLSDGRSVQPAWDSNALSEVSQREAELEAKVSRLDNECTEAKADGDDVAYQDSFSRRQRAWDELVELRRIKSEAIKPDGRARDLNKPNEKAHESIRVAIRRAVEHLDKKGLKRLALHFGEFVRGDGTGTGYVYCPDPMVDWTVEIPKAGYPDAARPVE